MTTFARAMSSSSIRRSLSGFDLIAKSLISFELRTSKVSESNSLASISRGRMPSAKHAEKEYKRSVSEKQSGLRAREVALTELGGPVWAARGLHGHS